MTQQDVIDLMKSSRSEDEWNVNCDAVKKAHGGDYPPDWYATIVLSGLMRAVTAAFGGSDEITIIALPEK